MTPEVSNVPLDRLLVPAGTNRAPWLIPAIVVVTLSALLVAAALLSQQWTRAEVARLSPSGGFYWPVAQYQLAHLRLKQELLAVATGRGTTTDAIRRRWSVLTSRAGVLVEPSQVQAQLGRIPGYTAATGQIGEMHRRLAPILDQPQISATQALRALEELDAIGDESLLINLANEARQAELAAQEGLQNSLSDRLGWIWAGLGLGSTILGLWLVSAVQSSRRLAKASAEREQAVRTMEDAIGIKRRFVSMVSHELRSPLQSIVTAAETLSQDLNMVNGRPQSIAAMRRIRNAVAGLQTQLRDLLAISRGDACLTDLQLQPFDSLELVSDVCADFGQAAADKGLVVTLVLPDESSVVQADPIRVAQVLRNLLENAIRYTASGGVTVTLEAMCTPTASAATPSTMRFTVADTGPGIPAAVVERIKSADPWLPPETSTEPANRPESMRIGLLVVHDVIHQLGGQIDLASRPGGGTTARVRIPVTLMGEASTTPHGPVGSGGSNQALLVLVVDDDKPTLDALQDALHRMGHRCDVASCAAIAEPLLANTHYDAVLIDMTMPGKSGLLLAQETRHSGGLSSRSMLILVSSPENAELGLHPPFDGFLQKPIGTPALRSLIGSRMPH